MFFLRPMILAVAATSASVHADPLRQYHQRALLDTCGNVNANIRIRGVSYGRYNGCLCVSGIPALLRSSNRRVRAALGSAGRLAVTAALNRMVRTAPDRRTCNYPDNAVAGCSGGGSGRVVRNPCSFACGAGFTPSPAGRPTTCVCAGGNTICNGVCGNFPTCSSQRAKREVNWRDATCPKGMSACGIWDHGKMSYECVDISKDLWSCGGCSHPLLPTDPTGVDCTAITGVSDVSCLNNRCKVQDCKVGFNVSADNTTCVPTTPMSSSLPAFVLNGDGVQKALDA